MSLSDRINKFISKAEKRYEVEYDWNAPRTRTKGHSSQMEFAPSKRAAKTQAAFKVPIKTGKMPKKFKVTPLD